MSIGMYLVSPPKTQWSLWYTLYHPQSDNECCDIRGEDAEYHPLDRQDTPDARRPASSPPVPEHTGTQRCKRTTKRLTSLPISKKFKPCPCFDFTLDWNS